MKISKEVKVAVLAIVAGILLYFGVEFLKGINFFNPTNTYYVIYTNVEGLAESNQITLSGYPVGRVSAIRVLQERNNNILVSFDLNEDIAVGADARAILRSSDFLGNKVIELEPGNVSVLMQPGDTLIGVQTQDITSELKETALPVVDSIKSTIHIVNTTLSDFETTKVKLDSILTGIALVIESNQKDIAQTTANLNTLSATLNDENKGVAPLLAKINVLADSLNDLELSKTLAQADATLRSLQLTVDKLKQDEGTLGKLMNNDSVYNNLNKTLVDLDSLFIDLQENPRRYVHFSLFGGKDKSE